MNFSKKIINKTGIRELINAINLADIPIIYDESIYNDIDELNKFLLQNFNLISKGLEKTIGVKLKTLDDLIKNFNLNNNIDNNNLFNIFKLSEYFDFNKLSNFIKVIYKIDNIVFPKKAIDNYFDFSIFIMQNINPIEDYYHTGFNKLDKFSYAKNFMEKYLK